TGRAARDTRGNAMTKHLFDRASSVALTAIIFAAIILAATQASAATCASLAGLALDDTTITAAQSIPAGTYTAPDGEAFPGLPAFCRVAATLTPSSDSSIKIEVWLPETTWNGRFLGTGGGGFQGVITH